MNAEMKAVVASLVVIAVALTAVSGITYSWFSDEETATINVTTGVIDIESTDATITVNDGTPKEFTFNNDETATTDLDTPLKPGDVISVKYETTNNSTIDAFLIIDCNLSVFTGKQTISTEVKSEESAVTPVSGHYVLTKGATYSVEITIEISTDADSTFANKTGTLTITNKAIQSDAPIAVSTAKDLTDALANEAIKSIEVTEDVTISSGKPVEINRDVTIDAGNKTITLTALNIGDEAQVTIKNGSLNTETPNSGVYVDARCSVELDNVTYNATGYGLYPRGDTASVTVKESKITAGVMAIATNAEVEDNYGVVITIENSEITTTSTDFDNAAVMINVEGTLNISNSKITGDRQALIVRAGTANVVDTDFISTGKYVEKDGSNRDTGKWAVGNEVSSATIVVGNLTSNAYKANASLSLDKDCTITNDNGGKTLIVAQDGKNGNKASISISSDAVSISAIKKTGFGSDSETTITISPGETVTVQ